MALDQNVAPSTPESLPRSAIENEIPAYRAVNPQAVISLLLGVFSILSFTNVFFELFAVGAVAFGFFAQRRIRRFSDVWTGLTLAQAGMVLGLVFGVSSITTAFAQSFVRTRQATGFASDYAKVLKNGKLEDGFWYCFPPRIRENKTPADLLKEFKSTNGLATLETQYSEFLSLKKRLDQAGADIHFERIEGHGVEGLTSYAAALLEVHGHDEEAKGPAEQFALILLKGMDHKGKHRWWVETVKFPYEPNSHVHELKPVDDGHGHAPGQHH